MRPQRILAFTVAALLCLGVSSLDSQTWDVHHAFQGTFIGSELQQILLPEPDPGMVRVPLSANIQNDGLVKTSQIVHAILRRTGSIPDPGWNFSGPTISVLWARTLMREVMVGGEFFIPVEVFPIPHGWEIYVEWSNASGAHCHRAYSVSVQVPADQFDWSKAATNFGQFKFVAP